MTKPEPRGLHKPEVALNVTVTLGAFESDDRIEVEVADDTAYVPEVASDLLRRCCDTALRMYRDLHPAEKETA